MTARFAEWLGARAPDRLDECAWLGAQVACLAAEQTKHGEIAYVRIAIKQACVDPPFRLANQFRVLRGDEENHLITIVCLIVGCLRYDYGKYG
jgi:hypothetical protein